MEAYPRESKELKKLSILTGQRDTDLLILSNLNDESLFSFCQVDRYAANLCQNEDFWRNRFINKYGAELIDIKLPNRSWKNFYLGIEYYNNLYKDWDFSLNEAAKKGSKQIDFINFFLSQGAGASYKALATAIKKQDYPLVNLFVNSFVPIDDDYFWRNAFNLAASVGNIDILNLLLTKGVRNFNQALYIAAEKGHKNMVEYLLQVSKYNQYTIDIYGIDDARNIARARRFATIEHILQTELHNRK